MVKITIFNSFASTGGDPQDIKYAVGQESNLIIGDNNLIREFCTINRGTEKENSITKVGSNNMLMAYSPRLPNRR